MHLSLFYETEQKQEGVFNTLMNTKMSLLILINVFVERKFFYLIKFVERISLNVQYLKTKKFKYFIKISSQCNN